MAKQIKQALIAAVIVFGGALLAGATMGAFGTFAMGTAATMATLTFATTLLGSVIGKMTSKSMDAAGGNFGSKFATRAALAPRQIVYGKCRIGGTMVHIETTGTDNYLLHMVVALAGHEIEELTNLRLNDINCTTSTSTISGSTVYTVTNADFRNSENDNKLDGNGALVRYTFQDGSQTAVDGFMNAQLTTMGTTDKFLGVAYIYIQMVFDAEKFGGGQPAVSFLVKGKNIYDPRTSANATTDLQRSNPALIIRDYLTNTQYGLKAKASEINDTTNAGGIASAANTCDQNVTLADGITTETRYTANGFTHFSANGNGVLEGLLSSMAGKMSYVNGQFTVFAGASQSPSLTITDDELLSPISVSTNSTSGELYNSVKPIYVDAALNYISTDAEVFQDATLLSNDTPSGESTANYVKQMETQLPFTVTDTMAQRLGRIALRSQRQTTSLSVLVSLQFMRCQPNDWVYLTNERLSYNQKVFEVLSTNMEVIQDDDVPVIATRLELKEIETAVFNFATNEYTTGQAEGSDVSTGSYAVTAPSNLALSQQSSIDGTTSKVDIKVSWTNNASDKVTLTEIAYKLSTDGDYTSDFTVGKRIAVGLIPNVVVGKTYNVKVRHIDVNGVASAYTNVVSLAIAVAGTAPSTPTNLTSSTGKQSILISWTNPNNSDLRAVKIYRRTANTTPTDDTYLMDTIAGEPNAITTSIFGDQDGLTAGTTYYFWVRAINHSGQQSGFSSSVNGTFTAAVIGDGTITELKLADEAVSNAKIAVDAVRANVIQAGAITTVKIDDNAITAAKILAGEVIAGKLAANSVVAVNIEADAVISGKINADAVTAREINVSTLSAISANVGTLTAGTIDAATLTINNINASKITSGTISTQRLNVADIISTGSIIVSGSNISALTNNSGYTTFDGGDITQALIESKITDATSFRNDIAAYAASNPSGYTTFAAGDVENAITNNVTTISGSKITTGTLNAANVNVINLNAGSITTGSLSASRLTLNGTTLTADGSGLKISTEGVATTQMAENAATVFDVSAGSFLPLGQAVTNQVLVTGSVIPAPPSGQAQNLAVIGNTMCTGNNQSATSNVIQLILQVRTATTEAGVASASYSVATNFQTRGEAGEAFQTATCDYTTTAGNFYQFRFLVTYNNLAVMTGATRGYGPSTLQVISAYR
jgi:hypothetical protein